MWIWSAGLSTLFAAVGAAQSNAQCYMVDGSPADQRFTPCKPGQENSSCCAGESDLCLSSGLCVANVEGWTSLVYSNACTSADWDTNECPKVCPDHLMSKNSNGEPIMVWNLLQCEAGGVFCCRDHQDSKNCCGDEDARVTIKVGTIIPRTTVTTATWSQPPTTSKTSSSQPPESTTTAPQDCSNEPLNSQMPTSQECPKDKSAIVGGAVGGVLGAALLGALGALAFVLFRRQNATPPPDYVPPVAHELRHSNTRATSSRSLFHPQELD